MELDTYMPPIYSYTFSENPIDLSWGVQCSKDTYHSFLNGMDGVSRCFIYVINERGESVAVAVEGFHTQDADILLAPDWLIDRLACSYGDEVSLEFIDEPLPKAHTITLKPALSTSTDSPVFVECLTEALNKLGIIQLGTISLQLDPSLPDYHTFLVESLTPGPVCFADGEVNIEFLPAIDSSPDPADAITTPAHIPTDTPCDFSSMVPLSLSSITNGVIPFSGQGRRLGSNT